jgi:hypothetical protein
MEVTTMPEERPDLKVAPPDLKLVEATNSDDPFALSELQLDQDLQAGTAVKKLLTTVPVRRPGAQDFFRVHAGKEYRHVLAFLELKDDREIWLVNLRKVPDLQPECFAATLYTCMTRTGVLFMWPVRVPAVDGRVNEWHTSATTAAELAMRHWIRMKANMSLRAY